MSTSDPTLFFFGCWNKGRCDIDKPTNPVSNVMSKLRADISTTPTTEYVIVGGDNYYPHKEPRDGGSKTEKSKKSKTKVKVPRKLVINDTDLISGLLVSKSYRKVFLRI